MAKKRIQNRLTPKRIKEIRAERGLTQAEAAARIGIARRTWMYYEAGKQKPSRPIEILIRLLAEQKI